MGSKKSVAFSDKAKIRRGDERRLPRKGADIDTASPFKRARFDKLFETSVAQKKLTLLVAPAGYGKTMLMRQWIDAATGDRVVHLSIFPRELSRCEENRSHLQ